MCKNVYQSVSLKKLISVFECEKAGGEIRNEGVKRVNVEKMRGVGQGMR